MCTFETCNKNSALRKGRCRPSLWPWAERPSSGSDLVPWANVGEEGTLHRVARVSAQGLVAKEAEEEEGRVAMDGHEDMPVSVERAEIEE